MYVCMYVYTHDFVTQQTLAQAAQIFTSGCSCGAMIHLVSLTEDSDSDTVRPKKPKDANAPQLRVHAPKLQLHADEEQTYVPGSSSASGSGAAVAAPPAGGMALPAHGEMSSSETESIDEATMKQRADEAY